MTSPSGCSLSFSRFPAPVPLSESAAASWDQKTKFYNLLRLFCAFSPLGSPDSSPGRAEHILLVYFCVRHKSLCLKLVLKLVYKAETRSGL